MESNSIFEVSTFLISSFPKNSISFFLFIPKELLSSFSLFNHYSHNYSFELKVNFTIKNKIFVCLKRLEDTV